MNKDLWLKRIRNYAGFLGGLLPWLALLSASLYDAISGTLPAAFWKDFSISATYYCSPVLPAILTAASIVLMCYDGYTKLDNIVTTLSGVFGVMIVLFPCKCALISDYVGFFQCPVKISSIIHNTSATIFFLLLSFNALFLFTKHDGNMTEKKKQRNFIYRVCGGGMLLALILMPLPIYFYAKTWVIETIALSFFALSWLVKGGAIESLNDEEEEEDDE